MDTAPYDKLCSGNTVTDGNGFTECNTDFNFNTVRNGDCDIDCCNFGDADGITDLYAGGNAGGAV